MVARSLRESNVSPTQYTSSSRSAGVLAVVLSSVGLFGCASADEASPAPAPDERTGSVSSAIYDGVRDDGPTASDAVVALRVGDKSPFELCTGTLLAPNVVLTARHCVSKNTADEIDCTETGESKSGAQVGDDVMPRNIHVMLGTAPDFGAPPAARGKLVFRPVGSALCNTDIAIVVLDKAIPNIQPLPVRLKGGVLAGERIRSVGYGENDQKVRIGTRFHKDDVTILAVGPKKRDDATGRPAIADREFEVGMSICQGDSGGPAISQRTGAVVGVVSRGVGCDLDFGHIYTTTTGFGTLFREAFAAAGATPIPEPEATTAQGFAGATDGNPASYVAGEGDVGPTNRVTSAESQSGCSTGGARPSGAGAVVSALLSLGLFAFLSRRMPRVRARAHAKVLRIRPRNVDGPR